MSTKTALPAQCLLICALSFQYGYNIAALNALQAPLSCPGQHRQWSLAALPECFDMTSNQFGFLSSIYTIGGLFGSLVAGSIADKRGRRTATLLAASVVGSGSALMSLAPAFFILVVGRLIIGIGCGMATVIVPTFLAEIAPAERKGSIGVLNQLGIVVGIFVGQAASISLADRSLWRFVLVISATVAGAQLILGSGLAESPMWLSSRGVTSVHPEDGVLFDEERDSQEARLLSDTSQQSPSVSKPPPTSMLGVLTSPITRKGLRIVLLTQITQQASGVNAVLYFSTDILRNVIPAFAGYIALLITAVNLIMTFPPLYLTDRVGRRPLLLLSTALMCCSSLLLSLTIASSPILASASIIGFVSAFSIGLGPIPFLLIGEVVPSQSTAAMGSLGLSVNWIINGLVGVSFMPLQDWLGAQGVFAMFSTILGVATVLIAIVYR